MRKAHDLDARTCFLLLALVLRAAASDLDVARESYAAGRNALMKDELREAKRLIAAALETGQRAGMSAQELTGIRISLGVACRGLYELKAADELLSQARQDLERRSETNSNLYARALGALGTLRIDQRQFAAAETLLRGALEVFRTTAGAKDPKAIAVLAQLGETLFALGRLAEGESAIVGAIEQFRETGDQTALLGNALAALGRIRLAQGRFREAQAVLTESIDVHLRASGESGAAADSLTSLAIAFRMGGQSDRAVPLLRRAEKTYAGSGDIRMVSVWMLLGAIELDEGKATLGERHFRDAVECSERVEGPNGLFTAVARVGLARALAWQRKLKEAKAEIDVALEVEQKSLGPSREEIAEALLVSAEIAGLSKEYAAADRNFRDAIELYSALLPPDHPSLIVARSEYASFLKHKKK